MDINALIDEYGLDLNDIRWYLSGRIAQTIKTLAADINDLTAYIWSGKLEGDIYNIEETYLEKLQEDMERRIKTESEIRDILGHIIQARDKKIKYM